MLCYAILCYTLQASVPELSLLAKPYWPNRHDDQMALVETPEGNESYTPTTHGHLWHGPNHGPAHDPIAIFTALIAMALVAMNLTWGPRI